MMQFHENAAVIAWWCARFGRLLAWFTPVRRRLFLALLTLVVLVRKPLSLMGEQAALPLPKDAVGLAAVVLVLLALVWLCYQAAVKFAALPAVVRRNPQWTLHLFFWAMLALLWNTLPTAGLWREVLLGVESFSMTTFFSDLSADFSFFASSLSWSGASAGVRDSISAPRLLSRRPFS